MKPKITKITLAVAVLIGATALTAPAQTSEMDQLKATMETMQQNMKQMQQKISDLEKEKAAAATNMTTTNGTSVTAVFAPTTKDINGHPSQVTSRDALNDQQEGAPRPNDLTLNPEYRGFIPIPNTPVMMRFNAKPRVDATSDSRNSGNNDRFVTATIPVKGDPNYGGGEVFNMNARGSSLSLDVRAPDMPGDFRFYYNNDFFGGGNGGGMGYRVKQLYGQFYNVTAGFTYSIFEDPDVWPDTVDFEGPNSMIFARQATVRYAIPLSDKLEFNVGVQQPSSDIDNSTGAATTATPVSHLPDGGFNFRWEDAKIGHVQAAAILRDVGARSPTLGDQTVLGWGLNLSANLNVFAKDSVQAQFTYGDGIFHFCNDNFTYAGFNGGDAAYNGTTLRALTYIAPTLGYTHSWSDKFRSTATCGYVNLQNTVSQSGAAYHETVYGSVNVVWQLRKHLSIGFEGLYGYKKDKSEATGDVMRFQTGLVYSLF
jgi:DcaP outer membrane protein